MANLYADIPPSVLTEFARLTLAEEDQPRNQPTLNPWFPAQLNRTITYRFNTGTTRSYTAAAPYRGFDTPTPIGSRPGRGYVEGELPPISIKYIMREEDILRYNAMVAAGGSFAEVIEGDVFNDVENGIRAVVNRQQLAMRDFLVDGVVTITDRRMSQTIDAGRSGTRESAVGIAWSNTATAAPFAEERAIVNLMRQEESLGWNDMVVLANEATWQEYQAIDEVISAYGSNRLLSRLSEDQTRQVRAESRLPDVLVIDRTIAGVDGATEDLIPDGAWIYVPKNEVVGSTQYGIPAVASLKGIDIKRDDQPGPIAYVMEDTGDPVGYETNIQALGVPVFEAPDRTYALTV